MADATSRLRLVVDSTGVDRAGRKLKDLRRNARDAETAAARLKNAFAGLAGVLGAAFSVRAISQAADEFTTINNRIRLVTSSAQELNSTIKALGLIAIRTQANFEGTVTLFSRIEQFAGEAFKSQKQALDFTEAIQNAFLAAGASAQEASNAVRQLTQGLASGELRGEEFRSVSEQAPLLAKAITDAIGDGTKSAFELAKEGAFTTEKVVEAVLGRIEEFKKAAANVAPTIGRSFEVLRTQFLLAFGPQLVKAGEGVSRFILLIGDNLDKIIPLAEGAAAALLTLGAAFAASSALAAAPAILAAIVSPLGLLAIAIAGLVAFRDDIAEWAFGVRDAGVVVQAAIEVLRPKFVALFDTIKAVAAGSLDILKKFGADVEELFRVLAGLIQQYFGVIFEAVNRVQIAAKTSELEALAKRQEALTKRLKDNLADPLQDAALVSGTKLIREELDGVNAAISKTSEELNKLLNPTEGLGGIGATLEEISERAKEIEAAKLADPFEDANDSAERLKKTTKEVSDELKKLAAGISAGFLDIKIDEKLGLFGGLDQGRLNQQQRDQAFRDFERQFEQLGVILAKEVAEVSKLDAELGAKLNADYLAKLADLYSDYFRDYRDANEEHAALLRDAIAGTTNRLFDDLIFNGAKNFGRILKDTFRDAFGKNIIDPISKSISAALTGENGLISKLSSSFSKVFGTQLSAVLGPIGIGVAAGFAGFQIGKGLNNLLGISGNPKSVKVGAAVGGALGAVLAGLFSKPSDNAAGGGVNFKSFAAENQFNKGLQNVEARDELLNATGSLAKLLAQLTGSKLTGSGISIQVGSRNGTRIISAAGGDVTTPVGDAEAATAEIFRQLAASLRGGEAALVNLTKAAANSKANIDEVVDVLGALSEIAKAGEPPISKYGEALQKLDALLTQVANSAAVRAQAITLLRNAFEDDVARAIEEIKDPAVAGFRELARNLATVLNDATALGVDTSAGSEVMELIGLQIAGFFEQAAAGGEDIVALTMKLSELGDILTDLGIDANVAAQALQKALATQRDAFDSKVLDDISKFLTGPLDQLERLLEQQKKRIEQAEALGADLTQVERLSALELRQFFQGLSDSALDEVRDFLGLFEEAADSVARNLDLSRQDLQARADSFGQFAQQFASLATDFRERFVAASPRESLDILRGRASELLGEIGKGNESAAQALPQVLNQLVENARQTFGNTKGFQEVLDFALGTLSEAEKSSLSVQSEAERQIAALDESNDLLTDIRDILQSSAAFNALLQSSANGGVASSTELLALIQSGAGLTANPANANSATLSVTGLIAQSLAPVFTPLVVSIDNFTQSMSQMPYLQRLQIEAVDNGATAIVTALDDVSNRLDRIEVIQKQALVELQQAA